MLLLITLESQLGEGHKDYMCIVTRILSSWENHSWGEQSLECEVDHAWLVKPRRLSVVPSPLCSIMFETLPPTKEVLHLILYSTQSPTEKKTSSQLAWWVTLSVGMNHVHVFFSLSTVTVGRSPNKPLNQTKLQGHFKCLFNDRYSLCFAPCCCCQI